MDIELLRKIANVEQGRRFLEHEEPVVESSLDYIEQLKLASVEDLELLAVASALEGDKLANYQALGGKYKQAFGTPMFQMSPVQSPGMGGAPAAGGMKSPMAKPGGMAGPKMPGAGSGTTNPMQSASTPQIPGTSGPGSK